MKNKFIAVLTFIKNIFVKCFQFLKKHRKFILTLFVIYFTAIYFFLFGYFYKNEYEQYSSSSSTITLTSAVEPDTDERTTYYCLPTLVYQNTISTYYSSLGDILVYSDFDGSGRQVPVLSFYDRGGSVIGYILKLAYNTGSQVKYVSEELVDIDFYTGDIENKFTSYQFELQVYYNYGGNLNYSQNLNNIVTEADRLVRRSYASGNATDGYKYNVQYIYYSGSQTVATFYFLGKDVFYGYYPSELNFTYSPLYYIDTNSMYWLGYDEGELIGYGQGSTDGYIAGYGDGEAYGHTIGYLEGYNKGEQDALLGQSPWEAIVNGFNQILGVRVFGTVTVGNLLLLGCGVVLFGALLKIFRF